VTQERICLKVGGQMLPNTSSLPEIRYDSGVLMSWRKLKKGKLCREVNVLGGSKGDFPSKFN
jgi:hypothetical protein